MAIVLDQIGGDPKVAALEIGTKKPSKRRTNNGGIENLNEAGRLADLFLLQKYSLGGKPLLHICHDEFYRWTKTHYKHTEKDQLRAELYRFIKTQAEDKRTNGLLLTTWAFVWAEAYMDGERELNTWLNYPEHLQPPQAIVTFRNGLLDLNQPQEGLMPTTPDWFSATCLPFNYDPDAKAPLWQKYLEGCFTGDKERIALLQEWFGYCLMPDTSLNKFMLFEGPPRAGKGVCADVLAKLLGMNNVSSIRLESLANRFDLGHTVNKLLNICDETDQIERVAEAVLKALTGPTAKFFFDRKTIKGIEATVTARFLIISNNGIPIHDRSMALVERMLHLQFDHSFVDKEDTTLRNKLYTEAAGIFNWALEGYKRINQGDRRFTRPQRSLQTISEYKEAANTFKQWAEDHLEATNSEEDYITNSNLVEKHNEWLQANGYKRISATTVKREMRRLFLGIKEGRPYVQQPDDVAKQVRSWLGVRWL